MIENYQLKISVKCRPASGHGLLVPRKDTHQIGAAQPPEYGLFAFGKVIWKGMQKGIYLLVPSPSGALL